MNVHGREMSPLTLAFRTRQASKRGMTLAAWLDFLDAEEARERRHIELCTNRDVQRDVLRRYAQLWRRTFVVLGGAP